MKLSAASTTSTLAAAFLVAAASTLCLTTHGSLIDASLDLTGAGVDLENEMDLMYGGNHEEYHNEYKANTIYHYNHNIGITTGVDDLDDGNDKGNNVEIIDGILNQEEFDHYTKLVSSSSDDDQAQTGRIKTDAFMGDILITRIRNIVFEITDVNYHDFSDEEDHRNSDPETCAEDKSYSRGATVTVSKLTKSLAMHNDFYHHSRDVPVHDHVGFINLKESTSFFVLEEEEDGKKIERKIPMRANSMVVFRGNFTHGIPIIEEDGTAASEVQFLGPFELRGMTEVGSVCPGGCLDEPVCLPGSTARGVCIPDVPPPPVIPPFIPPLPACDCLITCEDVEDDKDNEKQS